jgi:nucleoside-diphosphate-sugar epimerase
MRVLILGGTGLTGPFVARRLYALGHEVTVFHRGEHQADLPSAVRRLHGKLADPPAELRDLAPDVVVHMWAMTEADALAFLALFRGVAGRAVVISSCDVYRAYGLLSRLESGPPDPVPLSEDAPLRESRDPDRGKNLPIDTELYDKILVEQALMGQPDLPVTIVRYPAVYGPNDAQHRFRPWLQAMEADQVRVRMQEGFAQWRWTHGYAEDMAEAVVLAATKDTAAGRIYNAGEAVAPVWAERIEELAQWIGWTGRLVIVPASELPENQRMPHDFAHHLVIDTSRIRLELGYAEIVPRDEAIARTIASERK